jgi:hypothetical protein
MTSNIVPGNIDGSFPVAGQDNSSQGFRDNFTAIKNNFTEAKSEIEDLQDNKASTDADTSFNDYTVTRAVFKDTAEKVYAFGTTNGAITLNYENGHYQTITTNGSVSLAFNNFPASATLGRVIIDITYASTSHTLTVTSAVLAADNVSGFNAGTNIITAPTAGRYLYEFVTPDGGTTVLMHQLGKLYTTTP